MKLTTKGRFAVTAMIDLALRQGDGPVALASISERQKISLSYLEQLFGKLRRNGLVASVRGPGGGYHMAKPTTVVSVADIIRAVDEPVDATLCNGKSNCNDEETCMTHVLWSSLTNRMLDYLSSVSLAELVEQQRSKIGSAALMKERELRAQSRRPRRTIAVAAA
ncbi:MAG: Rrf2 family transcriptional regulator [Sterolibacterium sp.]|nr:Rrf2 family transcriptional regulator [Sterolibacterium sp.]